MKQALLVIDVQNDYFPKGRMALENPDNALKVINQLEKYFSDKDLPIVYVQHVNEAPAGFFEKGTEGVALHPALKKNQSSIVIDKKFPNSFYQTDLKSRLDALQVEQLVITGMMTHMCVDSTTRASKELGYEPILISDATATKQLQIQGKNITAAKVQAAFLAALQTFANVITAEQFIKDKNPQK